MRVIHRFHIPAHSGYAFRVARSQIVRINQPEGSQVADFNALNATNPRETFSSSTTRQLEGRHLTTRAQLWSLPPWEEPLLTITGDSVPHKRSARGATSHDLLFGRCTRNYRLRHYGVDTPGCQENLAAALAAFGLGEEVVHDPFNIFMKTGGRPRRSLFFEDPDSRQGNYVELRAERDLIVAISACPGKSSGPRSNALEVEILQEDERR